MNHVWAIVMAGGVGSRFWPVSRRQRPKQLLDLFGEGPMLQTTIDRISPLLPREQIVVVTGEHLVDPIADAAPTVLERNVLAEPVGRNTAAAVAWGALHVRAQDPDAILAVLPADHHIVDVDCFRARVVTALAGAVEGHIVTLGVAPTRPETGYGYVRRGARLDDELYAVDRFVEKPDVATAATYLAAGDYLWNAGMFFMPVGLIIDELRAHAPELMRRLEAAFEAGTVAETYADLPSISIDYAVMEHTEHAAVVTGDFGWSDVGSWHSLFDHRAPGARSFVAGDVLEEDGGGNVLFADHGGTIAAIGVSDLVIVHTRDATFVCPREHAQRAKDIVRRLTEEGWEELL